MNCQHLADHRSFSENSTLKEFFFFQETIEDIDKNKDGKINIDEYIGKSKLQFSHSWRKISPVNDPLVQLSEIEASSPSEQHMKHFTFS